MVKKLTIHAGPVGLERDEDVRRCDAVLLCELLHYRILDEWCAVGSERRVRGDDHPVLPAFLHNVLLHAGADPNFEQCEYYPCGWTSYCAYG